MVFLPYGGRQVEYIPDDTIIPELIFNPRFGRRPLSQSNKALFVDAPTGRQFGYEEIQERTEALAVGLRDSLATEASWTGVVGLFAPNSVCLRGPRADAGQYPFCVLGDT